MNELAERRAQAAAEARGGSCQAVYDGFLGLVQRHDLGGSLLDFGAGRGALANSLLATGRFHRVVAADLIPAPERPDPAVSWLSADLNAPLPVTDELFDVIVAAEVIEHLENPRAVIRDWYRLLRPGGTLLFSTPNNESLRALIALVVRGHFVAFSDSCYPAHITALLRKDLERILTEVGFASPKISFSNDGGIPGFPNLRWGSISVGRLRGLRFSDNLFVHTRKPQR
jgi:2-polyprenyl-3-methyl-5-hydroxy-6-metoxy-1,4-benzoquinol methylase